MAYMSCEFNKISKVKQFAVIETRLKDEPHCIPNKYKAHAE